MVLILRSEINPRAKLSPTMGRSDFALCPILWPKWLSQKELNQLQGHQGQIGALRVKHACLKFTLYVGHFSVSHVF